MRDAEVDLGVALPVGNPLLRPLTGRIDLRNHRYENNILFQDPGLTADMRQRQQDYIARSRAVEADEVAAWSMAHRLWNNSIAMLGPIF